MVDTHAGVPASTQVRVVSANASVSQVLTQVEMQQTMQWVTVTETFAEPKRGHMIRQLAGVNTSNEMSVAAIELTQLARRTRAAFTREVRAGFHDNGITITSIMPGRLITGELTVDGVTSYVAVRNATNGVAVIATVMVVSDESGAWVRRQRADNLALQQTVKLARP